MFIIFESLSLSVLFKTKKINWFWNKWLNRCLTISTNFGHLYRCRLSCVSLFFYFDLSYCSTRLRGFLFVEFNSHRELRLPRRKLERNFLQNNYTRGRAKLRPIFRPGRNRSFDSIHRPPFSVGRATIFLPIALRWLAATFTTLQINRLRSL